MASLGTVCGTIAAEITFQIIRSSGLIGGVKLASTSFGLINDYAIKHARPDDLLGEVFNDSIDAINDAYFSRHH